VYDGVVPEYSEMVDEMCSGPVVALEVRSKPQLLSDTEGRGTNPQQEVVESLRAHAGPWDVNMAKELYSDTIRGKFGRDRISSTDFSIRGVTVDTWLQTSRILGESDGAASHFGEEDVDWSSIRERPFVKPMPKDRITELEHYPSRY
jgi:hypothetical protein